MITATITGRLIDDAKLQEKSDNKFITFSVGTNNRQNESVIVNCIRFVQDQPKNFESYKKGAIVSATGEPSINLYTDSKEVQKASMQLNVSNSQIISKSND